MYIAGDNSGIEFGLNKNISDIKSGLSEIVKNNDSAKVTTLIFQDFKKTDTKVELITDEFNIIDITKEIGFSGNENSGSIETFTKFLKFANTNFSAEKVILSFESHGSGIFGTPSETAETSEKYSEILLSSRAICPDVTSDNSFIYENQLPQAFDNAGFTSENKIDLVFFDLCLEAGIEVAYELRKNAEYILFSPDNIPGAGFPYKKFASLFTKNNDIETFGRKCVEIYKNEYSSYSAYNCTLTFADLNEEKINSICKNVSEFSNYICSNPTLQERAKTYLNWNAKYSNTNFIIQSNTINRNELLCYQGTYAAMFDLGFFTQNMKIFSSDNNFIQICKNLLNSLDNIIISAWKQKNSTMENFYDDYRNGETRNIYGLTIATQGFVISNEKLLAYLKNYTLKTTVSPGRYVYNPYYSTDFAFKTDSTWKNLLKTLFPNEFKLY